MQSSVVEGHSRWLDAARAVYYVAAAFGIDVRRMFRGVKDLSRFWSSALAYQKLCSSGQPFAFSWARLRPRFGEWREAAGGGHYFWQDLWAARKIFEARPARHVDVGSRIDGFVAHVLCFMPVTVVDIRPLPVCVSGLNFIQEDGTELSSFADSSIESLSSLHAVEHFGLGRYGDPVDPAAPFRAMKALQRVLQPGGRLYFAVPVGRERVEFNAHRIFAPTTVLAAFKDLQLLSFAGVDDCGNYLSEVSPEHFTTARYALGLFEFTK